MEGGKDKGEDEGEGEGEDEGAGADAGAGDKHMSSFYGTVPLVAGARAIADVGAGGLSGLLIGNESGFTLKISLEGTGFSKSLYPGTVDFFPIPSGQSFNGNVLIDNQSLLNNIVNWPSSFIQIDTYGIGETPTGYYPMPLPRTITGAVSTNVASTSAIQNDGNPTGTSMIEATTGGLQETLVTNDGLWTLSTLIAGALHQFLKTNASGNLLQLGNASAIVEVLGELLVDGALLTATGKVGASTAGDIIDASGGDTALKTRGVTNAIHLQSPAGTNVLDIAYNGITAYKAITLQPGFLQGNSSGTGLSGTYNHGLQGTPAAVLCVCDATSSSATVGAYSYTSTQFGMTIGGGLNGRWYTYR